MQFILDMSKMSRLEVIVEHHNERIPFSINVFQKKSFEQGFDVLEPINSFFLTLSPQRQDQLFEIYKECDRGFDQIFKSSDLHTHLSNQIYLLSELLPLRDIETWISIDPGFNIPSTLQEIFVQDAENKNSPEKTYLRSEYIELAAYSVFVRALIPIFGEYILSTRKELGVEKKEDEAVKLLYNTGILRSKTVLKLSEYIRQITKGEKRNFERILSGNSSLDNDDYLLALVTIRKLCIVDVRGHSGKPDLIASLYSFVFQKVFNPTKTDIPIREREFVTDDDRGNKRSIIESYRKRTEISLAEIAGFEHGYRNFHRTALRLEPTINLDEVDAYVQQARESSGERIGDVQLMMMAWTFKRIHSPNTIYYISPELIWQNLGVLEAVLWHWGLRYLSILATSHPLISEDGIPVSAIDNRGQIPANLQEEILKFYPFVWTNTKKSIGESVEEPNPVFQAIDIVVDDLLSNAWRATTNHARLVEIFGPDARRHLVVPPNIKTLFAELIIRIEKVNYVKHPLSMPYEVDTSV